MKLLPYSEFFVRLTTAIDASKSNDLGGKLYALLRGSIAQRLANLLPDPAAPGSYQSSRGLFSKRNYMAAALIDSALLIQRTVRSLIEPILYWLVAKGRDLSDCR